MTTVSLAPTTTTITPSLASITAGQSEMFTATVSTSSGAPTDGSVQFLVNGSDYGSAVPISGGTAQQSITEPTAGTYTVKAQYLGDQTNYAASPLSADASLSVLAAPASTPMSGAQTTALVSGLEALASWASGLDQYGLLGQSLPVVDQSIGSALDISNVLQVGLVGPLEGDAGNAVTSDAIVSTLKNLGNSGSGSNLTLGASQVTGGLESTAQGQVIEFSLDFQATQISSTGFDVGSNATPYGLQIEGSPTVTLTTKLNLDFTFGINASASNGFFFNVGSLTASASAQMKNPSFAAQLGFLGIQVQNATIDLDADLSATISDPSQIATNDVTASALENDSVSDLVTVVATSQSLSAMLPIQATLGTWTAAGSPTVTISSDNVFDGTAPAIAFNSDASTVLEFDRLTSTDFTGILSQLGTALTNVSPVLNIPGTSAELPFLGEQVNQVVSFSQMATDLTNDLSAQGIVGLPFVPENGQLASDATFSLAINGSTPVLVTVPAGYTLGNQTVEDLVANINAALNASGLSSQITASASGDEIALAAASPSVTQFQIQIANPSDNTADTQLGFAAGQTSESVFQFSTIQSLANLLTKLTGMTVTPQFDPTTNRLSFALDFTDAGFSQTLPLNFSTGLEPLYFDGAASAAVTATAGLSSTFEIDLGGLQAVLTGTGPAPANGQLTADAHFTIAIGTQSPVSVTVTAAATQTNSNLAGLLSDLNNALAAAGLGGAVVAGQTGGAITLTEVNGEVMQVSAATDDPATTELMLPSEAVQPDFGSNVYLDAGAQLTVSATVTANTISGSGSVGMLGVTIQNASLSYSSATGLASPGATRSTHSPTRP